MNKYDVIILGAGASGCICALKCAMRGKKVVIIDKNSIAGKKLLATGNGRCNLTNLNIFPTEQYYNTNIDNFISRFTPQNTISFFEKCGLLCYSDDCGRVYPISNQAKSVVEVLNNSMNNFKNLTKILENDIKNIDFEDNLYKISTDKDVFYGKNVVVAMGGNSGKQIAEKFNIACRDYIESLVALKTQNTKFLEGLRISPAKIVIIEKSEKFSQIGEVLFKDSGISGIVAFNASSFFARKGSFLGTLHLDIMPNTEKNELIKLLSKRKTLNLALNRFFDGMFANKIAYYILKLCNIDENKNSADLSDDEINKMATTIKDIQFDVKSCYDNNQIFSGGISLLELTENLQAKHQKGLYFCGEVCDVDGMCGGYNLQWAWTSGFIVGENI